MLGGELDLQRVQRPRPACRRRRRTARAPSGSHQDARRWRAQPGQCPLADPLGLGVGGLDGQPHQPDGMHVGEAAGDQGPGPVVRRRPGPGPGGWGRSRSGPAPAGRLTHRLGASGAGGSGRWHRRGWAARPTGRVRTASDAWSVGVSGDSRPSSSPRASARTAYWSATQRSALGVTVGRLVPGPHRAAALAGYPCDHPEWRG